MSDSWRESKQTATAVAKLAISHVSCGIEATALQCRLAALCYRVGYGSEAASLIGEATGMAKETMEPLLRASALAAIATAWLECGEVAAAAQLCDEARGIVFSGNVQPSIVQQAWLGVIYARLELEVASRDAAVAVISRARTLPDFLRLLATEQALRIYVALNDFSTAEKMLVDNSNLGEDLLVSSAFDLLHLAIINPDVLARSQWMAHVARHASLAVLMLWFAKHGLIGDTDEIWQRLRPDLVGRKLSSESVQKLSMACLAWGKLKRLDTARALFDKIFEWQKISRAEEIPSHVHCWIARVFAKFAGNEATRLLTRQGVGASGREVERAIVEQLTEDRNIQPALQLLRESNPVSKPEVLFDFSCAVLETRALLSKGELSEFRDIASSLQC